MERFLRHYVNNAVKELATSDCLIEKMEFELDF